MWIYNVKTSNLNDAKWRHTIVHIFAKYCSILESISRHTREEMINKIVVKYNNTLHILMSLTII